MLSASAAKRLNRVASGTLANGLGQILNIGGQFALVPVLLNYWGNQMYGEWLALSAMVTYLGTLDFGMQTYVVNRLNQCHSLRQMDEYTRVLHTGLLINLVIPFAGLALAMPLLVFAPLGRWLQLRVTDPSTAAWVAVLLSIQVVSSIGFGLLLGIYRTVNEYARGQMIANVRFALNLAVTVGVVMYGGQLRAVAVVQLILLAVTSVFVYCDISRRRSDVKIGLSSADWRLGLAFLAPSSMFLGIQLIGGLSVQGSTLLISSMFGAATLVVFASLRTLSNAIRQVAATLQHALWPEFTALDAQSQTATLRTMHLLGAKMVMATAIFSTVFLLTVGDRLITFWTRGRVSYDAPLMAAFLVLACSQAHWFSSSILISASNRQKLLLVCTTTAGLSGFVAGYVAAKWFGPVGFVAGMAVTDGLFCGLMLPWFACRLIGESRVRFFREVTLRSGLLLVATYAGVKLLLPIAGGLSSDLRSFVMVGVLTGLLGSAAAYAMSLNSFERSRLHAAVAGVLAR